jgi:hypothetical protein
VTLAFPLPAPCFYLLASCSPQSSVARTTRRNTTPRLPSAGPQARVQPGETSLQDCPAPGRRPSVLCPNPAPRYRLFAASGCRFYCRFWMPLLVAAWQNKITARYNTANQIADVEGIGELKLVSHCCSLLSIQYSLFTIHYSLFTEVMSHVTRI